MTVEWSKWGLNEIIRCCLYKRQHLIISFRGHSSVIQTSFHGQSRAYFFVWIPGWRNDGGMTDISEFIVFLPLRKPPHSTSFRHSISLLNDKEWKLQWEDSIQQSFWSFPLHSLIREWCWNDRMRPNEGVFLSKAKPLNLKTLSFGYIPSFHPNILFLIGSFHSFEGHFVIPISFQFKFNFKIIPCRRYTAFARSEWKNRVLSL